MVNYREIIRLNSLGSTKQDIASVLHCSRNTVADVIKKAKDLKIDWPIPEDITNQDLLSLLYPDRESEDENRMPIDFPKVHQELAKKGVTLSLLWTEYCEAAEAAGKSPYMSSRFGELYRNWARVSRATMRIQRKPGECLEVDWAGDTVDIFDSVTGEVTQVYLFVGTLSCSGYVYAELCRDMKSENFIHCHIHAYDYFGGVTRMLRPDNLKAGVTKNTRYETVIPRAYSEMADFYDTAIVPARPESPDDKPNAEASVKFATTWIIASLRNEHFFSFEEAQSAVAEKLEELNNKPFTRRPGCRRSAYEQEERAFMQSLPEKPYEPATWRTAKVQSDYTVTDGRNLYSVPYNLIGEHVDIRVTENIVEVFFHGSRVASHARKKDAQRDAIMKPEHMPEAHRQYLNYNEESFLSWADTVGPATTAVVRSFLEEGKVPEQGYKSCVTLMKASDRYGQERIEAACKRMLAFSPHPAIRSIMSILKNGQDKLPLSQVSSNQDEVPEKKSAKQGIIRGVDAFREGGGDE